jgi:hypothetical protein
MSLYQLFTESIKFFEAADPFASILQEKGKSARKSFITAAKKEKLNNVAIYAGLELLKRNDIIGKKYQWSIEDILLQVSGDGLFMSKELKEEYIKTERTIADDAAKKYGRHIADDIMTNFKEMERLKNEVIETNMSKIPKKPIHEFSKEQRAELKEVLIGAYKYYKTAVHNGFKGGILASDSMSDFVKELSKELNKIHTEFEFPEEHEKQLKKLIAVTRDLIAKNVLWEMPEKEIQSEQDLEAYFKQLNKSEPKQTEVREKIKTRHIHKKIMKDEKIDTKQAMKKMKDDPEKYDPRVKRKESKDMKSEAGEYKEKIKTAVNELKKQLATSEIIGDAEMKTINHKAESIASHKLSTGRTIETYLDKIENVQDAVGEIAAQIANKIK